jgi:hypothetical protein
LNFYLQQKITGYEQWAPGARREAAATLGNRREDQIKALNAATQAAVASVQGSIFELQTKQVYLTRALNQNYNQNQIQNQIQNQSQVLILGALQHLALLIEGNRGGNAAPAAVDAVAAAAGVDNADAGMDDANNNDGGGDDDDDDDDDDDAPPPARAAAPRPLNAMQHQYRVALAQDAVGMLRSAPRQPPLGAFPNSWVDACRIWEDENLGDFVNVDKTDWSNTMRSKYNKMKSVYNELIKKQGEEEREISLDRVAYYMDVMRDAEKTQRGKSFTLTQHLDVLKKVNPSVKKRMVFQRRRAPKSILRKRAAAVAQTATTTARTARQRRQQVQNEPINQHNRRQGTVQAEAVRRNQNRLRLEVQAQAQAGRNGGNWEQTGHTSGRGRSDPMDDTEY